MSVIGLSGSMTYVASHHIVENHRYIPVEFDSGIKDTIKEIRKWMRKGYNVVVPGISSFEEYHALKYVFGAVIVELSGNNSIDKRMVPDYRIRSDNYIHNLYSDVTRMIDDL